MIDRRTFLQGLASTVAAGMLLPKKLFAASPATSIGIQLYTIRDLVKQDFIGTLKMLSKIGYNSVEAAGYGNRKFYGLQPKEYALICLENGIQPTSTHSAINPVNAGEVIEDTVRAGMQYLVLPSVPKEHRQSVDDYKKLADDFNVIGEKCKNAGIKFGYHNHAFEFEKIDDLIPYDILLQQTMPDLCFMQTDLYWMVYAGFDPKAYFRRFPDRFELWHVKDMATNANKSSTEIGRGTIDYVELFKLKGKSGMKYFFVEQEEFTIDPIESISISFRFLEKIVAGQRR